MKVRSRIRATGVSAALLASTMMSGVAYAQEAAPPAAAPQTDENAATGDIVVTAQRRSESLQKVPLAVTAVSAERIDRLNLDDVQSLQLVTPGLVYTTGISYAQTYIRGIGSSFTNPGLEPAVATYVDGSYLERGFGTMLDIVDPGSIQVLKGPQGTLWGRNATGGAMLINTADPEFQLGGNAKVEVGNLGHVNAEGVLNAPLSDTVAIRLAGRYRKEGGYIRNLVDNFEFGGRESWTIRGKLAFKPSSDFSAVLEGQYDKVKRSPGANQEFLPPVYCAFCGTSTFSYPLSDPYTTVGNVINGGIGGRDRSSFVNLKMNYDLGSVTLNSVTAYRDTQNFEAGDFDFTEQPGFNLAQYSGSQTFTQDLTLTTNTGGIVNGVAGVSYLHDKSNFRLDFFNSTVLPTAPSVTDIIKTNSFSAFGELTVEPTPGLKLIGGGRYTHDSRSIFGPTGAFGEKVSFDSFTPRFVISYDAGAVNVYASYNQGFKAGGFNTPYFGGPANSVRPEKVKSYEAGIKYVSPDRSLRANLAAFTYNYKDLQVTAVDQVSGGSVLQNAASAKGSGFEFDFDYQPVSAIELFGGLTYLDAHYKDFKGAQVQIPLFNALNQPIGLGTGFVDLSGQPLARAPKWTAFAGATLKGNLTSGMKGELTGFVYTTSAYDFAPGGGGPLKADHQPAYTTVKLSGKLMPNDGPYEIGFFVDNLTNAKYYDFRFTTAPFGAEQVITRPRTYGVSVGVKF